MARYKTQKRKAFYRFSAVLLAGILFISLPFSTLAATSNCTPGLPCVTPKTPNDPLNAGDGPNISGPNALKSGSAACDADFMNQLYARAWLEADREMKAANIAIRKPDSVLEYSCFNKQLDIVAHRIAPIFSESHAFTNKTFTYSSLETGTYTTFMGDDKLDNSLEKLVLSSLKEYRNNNFVHDFLGGSLAGENSPPVSKIGDNSYNCDVMNTVSVAAQCANFGTDNQFFSFSDLAQLDPRVFPAECNNPVDSGKVDLASNKDFAYVNFDLFDDYTKLLGTGAACAPAIPTGVTVFQYTPQRDIEAPPGREETTYPDHVCSNPGCYYDPGSGSCNF